MNEVGEMPIPEQEHPEVDHVKHVVGEVLTRTYKDTSRGYMEAYNRVRKALPEGTLPRNIIDRLDGAAKAGAFGMGVVAQGKDFAWSITKLALNVHPLAAIALHFIPGSIMSAPERAVIHLESKAAEFIARRVYGGANRKDAIVEGITNGFGKAPPETNKVFFGRGKPS